MSDLDSNVIPMWPITVDDDVVYVRGPRDALTNTSTPRCREGHDLAVCECPWLERNKQTGADW